MSLVSSKMDRNFLNRRAFLEPELGSRSPFIKVFGTSVIAVAAMCAECDDARYGAGSLEIATVLPAKSCKKFRNGILILILRSNLCLIVR